MNRRVFLLGTGVAASCVRDTRSRLNVYNWSTYIDPAMVSVFERERGVRVHYGTYESNEEMLAKVAAGNSGWDVVFPTHSRLAPMARNGLLAALDHTRLPLLSNLDLKFQAPAWDSAMRWGVPYMWSATGIAFRRSGAGEPRSWAALWSPALRGRVTMLDDPEDVIGACLLKLGLPFGSIDPGELRRAKGEAVRQKQFLRAYLNAEVRDQLVAGDVLAAQLWSTTTAQAMQSDSKIGFVYPDDGYPLYCDCAAVLRESRRYELAHEFLNFLLRPEVAAANAKAGDTATANGAARLGGSRNLVLYPDGETYSRGIWPESLSSSGQRMRDKLWTEIKSA